MRYLQRLLILSLLALPFVSHTQGVIDTTLCLGNNDSGYFYAPYDTASYHFQWSTIDNNLLATEDSLVVLDFDSLILVSTPIDINEETLTDTFALSVRFAAIVMFDIPAVECYTGDQLTIIDNSIFDSDYTDVSYEPSLQDIEVGNGESAEVNIKYSIEGCPEQTNIDTTLTVSTLFTPELNFTSDEVCLGNTTITNSSNYSNTAIFSLMLKNNLESFDQSSDTFSIALVNGAMDSVFVQVTEGTCTARDTFIIKNKLQPTADFMPDKTCENMFLTVADSSQYLEDDVKYELQIDNKVYSDLTITDQLTHGVYDLLAIVDNNNLCRDTQYLEVNIDSVTYVTFTGLETKYCERQDVSQLLAQEHNGVNVNGGTFSGSSFLDDIGNGQAIFEPTAPDENIDITYTFTNDNMCTDSETIRVETIHAKPVRQLIGLDEINCEQGPIVNISLNESIFMNELSITKDDSNFVSDESLPYDFDPFLPGVYVFTNKYTDQNGCFDTAIESREVNPLPRVQLDSLEILIPGDDVLIGNQDSMPDPAVDFKWSNGSNEPSIEVSQPGIYFLTGTNGDTGCFAFDSIRIEFDPTVQDTLVGIQISPNPTMGEVTIALTAPAQNIRVVDVFGESIGASSYSTDGNNELSLDMSNQAFGYYYILIPNVGNFLLLKI